jgi:hypothetical protein
MRGKSIHEARQASLATVDACSLRVAGCGGVSFADLDGVSAKQATPYSRYHSRPVPPNHAYSKQYKWPVKHNFVQSDPVDRSAKSNNPTHRSAYARNGAKTLTRSQQCSSR